MEDYIVSNIEHDKNLEDDIDRIKRPRKKENAARIEIANATIVEDKPVKPVEVATPVKAKVKASVSITPTNVKDKRLLFGLSVDRQSIFISEKSRYANTLILGAKNSGKSSTVLPMLARQDMQNSECGLTFVVDKKDVAYTLYAMAKDNGRKVTILKPSANFDIANDFIQRTKYDYDFINEHVINYKEAIKKKHVVIIDMEYARYRQNAIRATAMLLMQLQIDMQDTQFTLKRPHYVYIDDSHRYLPFIELLLTSGDDYGIGTVLFLQGRAQLKMYDTDYAPIVDVNVRNTILMNGIAYEDAKHYSERFYDFTVKDLSDRKEGQLLYEIIDGNNARSTGKCNLIFINNSTKKEIEEKAKKARKQLNKYSRKAELDISLKEEEELNKLSRYRQEQKNMSTVQAIKEESSLVREIMSSEKANEKIESKKDVKLPDVEQMMESILVDEKPFKEEATIEHKKVIEPLTEIESEHESGEEEKLMRDISILSGLDNDIFSELSGLDGMNLPDDGLESYSDDEDTDDTNDEFISDIAVINNAQKTLVNHPKSDEEIDIGGSIAIDSLGDDYLLETRGYRPIKANLPRRGTSITASEKYMNDILNKKFK